MFNEVRFTQKRVNGMLQTEAVLMKTVIASALFGGTHLKEVLEQLDGE